MSSNKIFFDREKTFQLKPQVSSFNLVGKLLECVISSKAQIKYLRCASSQKECLIKISSKTSAAIDFDLTPGCWLFISGKKKLSPQTGSVKLKASVVELLPPVVSFTVNSRLLKPESVNYNNSPDYFSGSNRSNCPNNNYLSSKKLEKGLWKHLRIRGKFRCL